jgi:hypothetical protein
MLLVLGACKKPQIEVEEQGPPLPLPMDKSQNPQGATPSSEKDQPTLPAKKAKEPPLTLKNACKLLSAHLKSAGITVGKFECHNIRHQGESIRLANFVVPKTETHKELIVNACLWPSEEDDGWEVGYTDEVARPCFDREHFCKIGALGSVAALSFRGCDGDLERFVYSRPKLMDQLIGHWTIKNKGSVTIKENGRITIRNPKSKTINGKFKLVDAVTMDVQTDKKSGFLMHFALVGKSLHLSRGDIAPAKKPNSFVLVLSENLSVRRFRGACYLLRNPPRDHPVSIECPIKTGDYGASVSIRLNKGLTITLYRRGEYWVDAEGLARLYSKTTGKK